MDNLEWINSKESQSGADRPNMQRPGSTGSGPNELIPRLLAKITNQYKMDNLEWINSKESQSIGRMVYN
jgi:hypothetical protein